MTRSSLFGRRTGRRRGAALVEFALIGPLIVLMLMGILEFALIGHYKLTLNQAARAGSRTLAIGRTSADARETVRRAATNMTVSNNQIVLEFNSANNGTGSWLPVTDNSTGNNVPFGRLVRARVVNWEHQLVSGSTFAFLPGVSNGRIRLQAEMVMMRE